jgi:hypothetical protein
VGAVKSAATLLGLTLGTAAGAAAQDSTSAPAWLVGVGVANYALAEVHGTGWGPEGVVRRRLGPTVVLQARVTVIPSSSGFYDFGGAAADLGVGVVASSGTLDVALVAGASGLAGGDSDGSFFTAGGVHLMAQVTGWLGRPAGLYANLATRLLAGSGTDYGTTSGAAGVAFRF